MAEICYVPAGIWQRDEIAGGGWGWQGGLWGWGRGWGWEGGLQRACFGRPRALAWRLHERGSFSVVAELPSRAWEHGILYVSAVRVLITTTLFSPELKYWTSSKKICVLVKLVFFSFLFFSFEQASAQLFNYVQARVGIFSRWAPPPVVKAACFPPLIETDRTWQMWK